MTFFRWLSTTQHEPGSQRARAARFIDTYSSFAFAPDHDWPSVRAAVIRTALRFGLERDSLLVMVHHAYCEWEGVVRARDDAETLGKMP